MSKDARMPSKPLSELLSGGGVREVKPGPGQTPAALRRKLGGLRYGHRREEDR